MKQQYDVNYFINFFQSIPEEKWCIESYLNETGQSCAHGLVNKVSTVMNRELIALGDEYFSGGCIGFIDINNGDDSRYQQPTPKQRILAALYDIKAKQPIIPVFTSMIKKHEAEAVYYAREIARSLLAPREKEKV